VARERKGHGEGNGGMTRGTQNRQRSKGTETGEGTEETWQGHTETWQWDRRMARGTEEAWQGKRRTQAWRGNTRMATAVAREQRHGKETEEARGAENTRMATGQGTREAWQGNRKDMERDVARRHGEETEITGLAGDQRHGNGGMARGTEETWRGNTRMAMEQKRHGKKTWRGDREHTHGNGTREAWQGDRRDMARGQQ